MKCPHCLDSFNDAQTWCPFFSEKKTTLGGCSHGAIARHADDLSLGSRTDARLLMHACEHKKVKESSLQTLCAGFRFGQKGSLAFLSAPKYRLQSHKTMEACSVLADSPKASAALSRRCLQNLLRQAGGVKPGNLYDEIQQVIDAKQLPSTIADSIDAVRHIGNFASHPVKSNVTGEIVEVEPNEAEWSLDVLESLGDFYYVVPAKAQGCLKQKARGGP